MALWHASVLLASLGAPAVVLLGTTVLLVLSILLVGLGGRVLVGAVDPVIAARITDWVVVTATAFATVGLLVALHLDYTVAQFDGAPLIADLVTMGAAMGFLIGQYDGRRRQYQSQMRAERDRFASLFDNLPNPGVHYVLSDGEPVVYDANEAFERVFGFDVEAIRGTPINDLVVPDGREAEAEAIDRRLRDGEVIETEVRRLTANGLRDFQLYVVPSLGDEGFSISVDVTERKQHIRRLEVLNRVLRHDLRTDTNVIAGTADLLPESPETETIRDRALAMAERGETARRIERALDHTTRRRPVDLAALLRERAAAVEDATVHTDVQSVTVFGSDALGEAVDELLDNAVEHADSPDPTVWVTTHAGETFATVEIADDGPGLPEMERQVLDTGRETPLQHSSGLGLWLVRWIVEDLGGEVDTRDQDSGGTVVTLRLPRTDTDDEQ